MLPIIKHIAVEEFFTGCIRDQTAFVHLVKEEVAETVMDETALVKLHRHGVARLAAADDHRAGIRHRAEIAFLEWFNVMPISFKILESGDDLKAILGQFPDSLPHPGVIAIGYPGLCLGRPDELRPSRVATDKCQFVAIMLHSDSFSGFKNVFAGGVIDPPALAILIERVRQRLPAPIDAVVAG